MIDAQKKTGNSRGKTPAKRRAGVTSEILDRVPPYNLEAEYGVLGSMLIDPQCCDDVILEVSTADFYDDLNATAFATIEEMWNDSDAIDITTLREQLSKRMAADNHATPEGAAMKFMATITQSVANAAHAVYYAKIVREKSILRTLINSATEILRDAYKGTSDSQTLAAEAEQKIFAIQERTTEDPETVTDVMHAALESLERRRKGERPGVSTGYTDLDEMLGMLRPGELIVLAARPSMGKTAFLLNLVERTCLHHETKCLFMSLEMGRMELADRMLCSLAKVDLNKARNGRFGESETKKFVEAADQIFNRPIWIDDHAGIKVSKIAAKARRIKRRHGLDLIVIDYLQLIEPNDPRTPREQQVAEASKCLKAMAKNLGVPVIVVAQLNRNAEQGAEPRPKLSHLRESGSIEQDADVVMFVHRPEYFLSPEERQRRKDDGDAIIGQAEIIIAKQRNGPVGQVHLRWFEQFARFEEPAAERFNEFDTFNDRGYEPA